MPAIVRAFASTIITVNLLMGSAKEARVRWAFLVNLLCVAWIIALVVQPRGFPQLADMPVIGFLLPAISLAGLFACVYSVITSMSAIGQASFRTDEIMTLSARALVIACASFMVSSISGWTFLQFQKGAILAATILFAIAFGRLFVRLVRRNMAVVAFMDQQRRPAATSAASSN